MSHKKLSRILSSQIIPQMEDVELLPFTGKEEEIENIVAKVGFTTRPEYVAPFALNLA